MADFGQKYGRWAIVTGASAGIGKAIATELAARGLNIVAVARRQTLLDALQHELTRDHGVEVRTISADLTDPECISKIELVTSDLEIGMVVPNAGMELSGSFVHSSLEANERMLQLNVTAPMKMAKVFGAKMARRGHGGILFISSLFGYQGIPHVANYAATKAYILSLGSKATVVSGLLNKFYAWENRLLPRHFPVALFGFLIRRAFRRDCRGSTCGNTGGTSMAG